MDFTKEAGAIWERTSKRGNKFLSISLKIDGKDIRFVAFPNRKGNDKHPDWKIYEDSPNPATQPGLVKPAGIMQNTMKEEDIPF